MGLPAPWLIGLVLACVALAAIPTRRLSQAGLRSRWLSTYLSVIVVLGVLAVALRPADRYLVPLLVVLYLAPLVIGPQMIARLMWRGRRPPRNVGSGPGRTVGGVAGDGGRDRSPAWDARGGRDRGDEADRQPPRTVGDGPGRDVGPDDSPLP